MKYTYTHMHTKSYIESMVLLFVSEAPLNTWPELLPVRGQAEREYACKASVDHNHVGLYSAYCYSIIIMVSAI